MTKQKYNGWTNYETWNLKLWMDNDEPSSRFWAERAQAIYDDAKADGTFTRDERARLDLCAEIERQYSDIAQDALEGAGVECSWIADFLHAAIKEVNYYEIAESLMSDILIGF